MARTPEDAHAAGGLAQSWAASGNKAITVKEIDYAEALKDRQGEPATWDRILALLNDEREKSGDADEPLGMADMLELAMDSKRLAEFAERLQDLGRASGEDSTQRRKTLIELMHGLANYAAESQPAQLDAMLDRMAGAAAQMSPDMLLTLITDPLPLQPADSTAPRLDLGAELQSRLTDEMLTDFLVNNVVKDRGASDRLAAAFHTLVPDPARQQSILAAAGEQAAALFANDPELENVWSSSTAALTSYSDSQFVSEDYARELTSARTQAMDVDQIGDDPPARIRAWVSTVSDEEVRALDQRVLLDLLAIEVREEAWAGVLELTIGSIEQLVLLGELALAAQLVDAVVNTAKNPASPFAAHAAAGVKRFADGALVRHLSLFLRQATEAEVVLAAQICRTIGPTLVRPLADALAEDNVRTVRRLRDILIGFGSAARQYADELRGSANPAVRRAAVGLLRALGGEASLPELTALLDDREPQVQREALRAIAEIGTDEAYQVLGRALQSGQPHTREAIQQALGSLRDGRAAALFVYVLTHSGYNGRLEGEYLASIESLGRVANDERSVSTLKDILQRGEWYAPGRTRRIRAAAARALRGITLPSAERVLTEAAAGSGGVKRAAKAALAEPPPVRPALRRAP
jgi:HEAT repeat protein